MKTGDVVRDPNGQAYQVGPVLGRGLWGKSYAVRVGDGGEELVLKAPLTRGDFRGEVPASEELLDACREALVEQGRLLEQAEVPFLPRLHARFTTTAGIPVLVLPRYAATLDQRLSHGVSLTEVLATLLAALEQVRQLPGNRGLHGNLKPSNILLNERGDIFLADVVTPAWSKVAGRLHAIANSPVPYLPPELIGSLSESSFTSGADTYAAGMILCRTVLTARDGDDPEPPELPCKGLDKSALVDLKDRVRARMKEEDSNPRFHVRLAERVAALLNRALSYETSPSPPYRFNRIEDLVPRLEELQALIRPQITAVGKGLLSRPPAVDTFETGEEISFSVSVGASQGVEAHEEISCGIAVFDGSGERLRDLETAYTVDRHPSGRFRFLFRLPDLAPGGYLCRVAFAIRDSGHPPSTTEVGFTVQAAPGYVPPEAPAPPPTALPFKREDEADTAVAHVGDEPGAEPTPIAPSGPPAPPPPPPAALGTPAAGADAPPPPPPAASSAAATLPPGFEPEPAPAAPPSATPTVPLTPSAPPPAAAPTPPIATAPPAAGAAQVDPSVDQVLNPGTWSDLPLPGAKGAQDLTDHLATPADLPEPPAPGPVARLIDLVRSDAYMAVMLGGIVLIALFLVLLAVLAE